MVEIVDRRKRTRGITMKLALFIGLIGATGVQAAPYYVGQNINQPNHINLGFTDTMSKKSTAAGRSDTGNIAALELNGAYNITEDLSLKGGLPFYFANKGSTGGTTSRNSLGNISLGANYVYNLTSPKDSTQYGVGLTGDIFAPTARKDEANTVAAANPTTDLYRYKARGTSLFGLVHAFVKDGQWSARASFGGAFTRIGQKASRPADENRFNINWQAAASYEAMENMYVNLEYNTVYLGKATRSDSQTYVVSTERAALRHALTPSINGNWEQIMASAYVTVPLDKPTRDYTNVAFGLNAGYQF